MATIKEVEAAAERGVRFAKSDGTLRMSAGMWARGCAVAFASPNTTFTERERIIDEMRRIAQAAADAGLVELMKSDELPPGKV